MESKPMRWAELRERVAYAAQHAVDPVGLDLELLLCDIDAATPAMANQERRAESWNRVADMVATRSLMLLEQAAKESEHG